MQDYFLFFLNNLYLSDNVMHQYKTKRRPARQTVSRIFRQCNVSRVGIHGDQELPEVMGLGIHRNSEVLPGVLETF